MSTSALAGIKILDLSRVLAGPWASQLLADMGADVVKIERAGSGDDTRAWGPPWFRSDSGDYQQSAYFLSTNRNKRSIALDMSKPEDLRLIKQMAAEADVLIENFKVGGLQKYGLDYDSLSVSHPALIYCSITGFGQTGPYKDHAGYDFMIQAMGGLMSVTGMADEQGGEPVKVGVALCDVLTGLYASNGILAALHHRNTSGEGQHIDLALLDVQVATLANQASNYLVSGKAPGRLGNAHPNIVPYQSFETQDGYIIVAVGNDAQFARFCTVLGQAELADDARYQKNADRVLHRQHLLPILSTALRQQSSASWLEQLQQAGVPCGPINDIAQVFDHPQVKHRALHTTQPLADGSAVPGVANPLKFSRTPTVNACPPPLLDADRMAILDDWLGK